MDRLLYNKYLMSVEWFNKKKELFEKRGKVCEKCKSKKNIQVHHKTYKNLFNEKLQDLEVLCGSCHYKMHFTRKGNKKKILSVKQILINRVKGKKRKKN